MIGGNVTKTAVIYSDGSQECERIAQLLKALPDISEFHLYKVGEDFEQYQFEMEFGGDATYPQVSIGINHIGSIKETLQYLSQRRLL